MWGREAVSDTERCHGLKLYRVAVLAIALGGVSISSVSQAAETLPTDAKVRHYRIDPGSLGSALNQLASAAGIILTYAPELSEGRVTSGLDGEYSPAQALELLLLGTDLQAERLGEHSYALKPRARRGGRWTWGRPWSVPWRTARGWFAAAGRSTPSGRT